jgi:hypothetical protein
MKRNYIYMKQIALEKQGARQNTAESSQVKDEYHRMVNNQHHLKKVVRSVSRDAAMMTSIPLALVCARVCTCVLIG